MNEALCIIDVFGSVLVHLFNKQKSAYDCEIMI